MKLERNDRFLFTGKADTQFLRLVKINNKPVEDIRCRR